MEHVNTQNIIHRMAAFLRLHERKTTAVMYVLILFIFTYAPLQEQISRSNAAGHGSQNSDVSSRAAVDTDAAAGFTSAFTNPNIIFEQSSSMLALSPVSSVVSGIASDLAGAVVAAAVASAASSNQPAFQYVARLVAAAVRAALESQASVTGQPSTLQGR